jgi:hypothetical protein
MITSDFKERVSLFLVFFSAARPERGGSGILGIRNWALQGADVDVGSGRLYLVLGFTPVFG